MADRRSAAVFAVISLLSTACVTPHTIRTDELKHLDGFDIRNEREVNLETSVSGTDAKLVSGYTGVVATKRLLDTAGEPIDFTSKLTLRLFNKRTGVREGLYDSITVSEQEFKGALRRNGGWVEAPLADIQRAEIDVPDLGRTRLAIVGVTLGIVLLVVVGAAALAR